MLNYRSEFTLFTLSDLTCSTLDALRHTQIPTITETNCSLAPWDVLFWGACHEMHTLLTSSTQLNGLSSCIQHTLTHTHTDWAGIINSVFQFHNEPENFQVKQSGTLEAKDYISKVTSTGFSKSWLEFTGRADKQSPLFPPSPMSTTHILVYGEQQKKEKKNICWHMGAQKQPRSHQCADEKVLVDRRGSVWASDDTAAARLQATWWSDCMLVLGRAEMMTVMMASRWWGCGGGGQKWRDR